MFAKLVSWVKAAVLKAVVEEIVEEFSAAGHVVEVPEQLLLAYEQPVQEKPAKRARKNG